MLRTYSHYYIVPIKKLPLDGEPDVSPGSYCRHVDYPESFGIVVSSWDQRLQVLWTAAPIELEIHTQEIKPTVRKLKVSWSIVAT